MGVTPTHNPKFSVSAQRASVISLTVALLATTSISQAYAVAPTPPAAVNPANVEKQVTQPTTELPPSHLQAPVQQQPQLSAKTQAELAKKKFVLKSVTIEGNTVYSADALKFAYKDYLGKEISLLDAQTIVARITDLYHRNEYILSQAVIPAQDVKSGELKIKVIEGYISDVRISGAVKENNFRKVVESYASELKAIKPVRTSDLERYLLLMNDLPGASAKGVVVPSASKFGAAELDVTMAHKMFDGSYTIDNRGTKFVGPWEHSFTVDANSVLGMYDRTLLRFITASPTTELRFIDLQHEEQLGSEGTRLVLDGSYSETKPGDVLKPFQFVGTSGFFQAKLVHPFLRSRNENLNGRVMFDMRDTETDVFVNQDVNDDRLRVARLGGSYDFADRFLGVNLLDAQVSHGLNLFNASSSSASNRSTSRGDSDFTKFNLDLTRTQPLPHNFSLFTSASGQYAANSLLAAEQFTLGGATYGSAYDPTELAGDNGIAGRAELRYGQLLNDPYLQAYQLYGFYDIGRVWSRDLAANGNDKRSLASAGVGLRTNFSPTLSSDLQFAEPLTKPLNNEGLHDHSPRFFLSATARF